MERNHRRAANAAAYGTAVAAGYFAARVVSNWVERTLALIDEGFADLDFDDYDVDEAQQVDEPCVCGSTDHKSSRLVITETRGVLHNDIHGHLPLAVELFYMEHEPLAVHMRLTADIEVAPGRIVEDSQTWSFAREILDAAMSTTRVVGEGDVKAQCIDPDGVVAIWLTDSEGIGRRVDLGSAPVGDFLASTFAITPSGEETVDIDAELSELLGEN